MGGYGAGNSESPKGSQPGNGALVEGAGQWLPPRGPWSLAINGVLAPPGTTVYPDSKTYLLRLLTLCGAEEITVEATPTTAMSGAQFARRAQLASSIQHVVRRACAVCRGAYRTVTPAERKFLYALDPAVGEIAGVIRAVGPAETIGPGRTAGMVPVSPASLAHRAGRG